MLNVFSDKQFPDWRSLNINYQDAVVETFAYDCLLEAVKMQNTLVCFYRTVSFADILTKNLQTTAVHLSVDEIVIGLGEINIDLEFPIYAEMLNNRIKKATEMSHLLSSGYQSLKEILRDDRLQYPFLVETMKYLSVNDIKNLISAAFDH